MLLFLCFSLVGGLVADRANRRTILFMTQSISLLVAFVLGILTLFGVIQLWHIYVLTAIQASAMAFDLPARQSLVPNLVPREDLPNAFSLQSIAFSMGAIVGPALSGVVIGYLGQEYAYFINAFSFLAVIFALIAMGSVPQQRSIAEKGFKGRAPRHSRWDSIHPQPTVDLIQHDPGFLCHFFRICQHTAPLLFPVYPSHWRSGLWLAGRGTVCRSRGWLV